MRQALFALALWLMAALLASLACAEDNVDSSPRGTLYGRVERFDQKYVMLSMGEAKIVLPRSALADNPDLREGTYVTATPTFRDLIAPVPDWNRRPIEQAKHVQIRAE